jgi:cell division protein FtsQ
MKGNPAYSIRKTLAIAVWIILGSGAVVLLVAAITKNDNERIRGVEIHITGVQNNYFINKHAVLDLLEKINGQKLDDAPVSSLDLSAMENGLGKIPWVSKSELFFDNNNMLQVKIAEREPVARIFTVSGTSFYVDRSLTRLPLSDKFSARLPVFTGFPTGVRVLKKSDSALLESVKMLGEYIGTHPFWMAQIEQVDITSGNQFELVPKLGDQIIRFGSAENYEQKFNKLLAFYSQVQTRTGWNQYSVIDVQFKDQVVGVRRNAREAASDSLRAVQIMKNIISEAQKETNDSTKIQLPQTDDRDNDQINNSPVLPNVPDETTDETKIPVKRSSETNVRSVTPIHDPEKPLLKDQPPSGDRSAIRRPSSNERPNPTPSKTAKAGVPEKNGAVKKDVKKGAAKVKQVPKAVMPPKSDY